MFPEQGLNDTILSLEKNILISPQFFESMLFKRLIYDIPVLSFVYLIVIVSFLLNISLAVSKVILQNRFWFDILCLIINILIRTSERMFLFQQLVLLVNQK